MFPSFFGLQHKSLLTWSPEHVSTTTYRSKESAFWLVFFIQTFPCGPSSYLSCILSDLFDFFPCIGRYQYSHLWACGLTPLFNLHIVFRDVRESLKKKVLWKRIFASTIPTTSKTPLSWSASRAYGRRIEPRSGCGAKRGKRCTASFVVRKVSMGNLWGSPSFKML